MTAARPILVVEDDPAITDVVVWALEDEGYKVRTAADGAAALDAIDAAPPALIVLDMRMPVMDGASFAAAYHQMPGPHAPIVVLTASRDAQQSMLLTHAAGSLAKPFELADLMELIRQHLV